MANNVSFDESFMTDNFLTIVFVSSLVIALFIFLSKGKDESKSFLGVVMVIIVALFLLTIIWVGIKSLF